VLLASIPVHIAEIADAFPVSDALSPSWLASLAKLIAAIARKPKAALLAEIGEGYEAKGKAHSDKAGGPIHKAGCGRRKREKR